MRFTPGETFTHTWTVPFPSYLLDYAEVVYRQGTDVLTKSTDSFESDGENAKFTLEFTQADSLKFTPKVKATAQINLIFTSGARDMSYPVSFYVGEQYQLEVIPDVPSEL